MKNLATRLFADNVPVIVHTEILANGWSNVKRILFHLAIFVTYILTFVTIHHPAQPIFPVFDIFRPTYRDVFPAIPVSSPANTPSCYLAMIILLDKYISFCYDVIVPVTVTGNS